MNYVIRKTLQKLNFNKIMHIVMATLCLIPGMSGWNIGLAAASSLTWWHSVPTRDWKWVAKCRRRSVLLVGMDNSAARLSAVKRGSRICDGKSTVIRITKKVTAISDCLKPLAVLPALCALLNCVNIEEFKKYSRSVCYHEWSMYTASSEVRCIFC